jgi:hypothetical protein
VPRLAIARADVGRFAGERFGFGVGAVISTGGSCDIAGDDWVSARAAGAMVNRPSAAQLADSRAILESGRSRDRRACPVVVAFPDPMPRVPTPDSIRACGSFATSCCNVGIERKKLGQRQQGFAMFESIQIKTILISAFEIVLNADLKRSNLDRREIGLRMTLPRSRTSPSR